MDLIRIASQLFGVEPEQVDALQEFFNFSKNKDDYIKQFSLKKKQLREVMKLVIKELMDLPEDFKMFFVDGVDFALWRTDDMAVNHVVNVFRHATRIFETLPAIHDNPELCNGKIPFFKKIKDIDYGVFVGAEWSEVELARQVQRSMRSEQEQTELIERIEVKIRTRLQYVGE